MAEPRRITEPGLLNGLLTVDLSQPVIIQQEGKPIMVLLSYEEYLRLRRAADDQSLPAQ